MFSMAIPRRAATVKIAIPPQNYLINCTAPLAVSGLTLFSGFGPGTLLMPVSALIFETN
ncbi:MAG: hypothetical protein OEV89_08415 [Desulfobulbaceae bacterium]|nr:hypothetical protein [Desulfobulbaceae bacterium]HIJ90715.1 hypothetical protein [Deltaproteobacteria bacterium]